MIETDKIILPEEPDQMPADLFHQGTNYASYDYPGVHAAAEHGAKCTNTFAMRASG